MASPLTFTGRVYQLVNSMIVDAEHDAPLPGARAATPSRAVRRVSPSIRGANGGKLGTVAVERILEAVGRISSDVGSTFAGRDVLCWSSDWRAEGPAVELGRACAVVSIEAFQQ